MGLKHVLHRLFTGEEHETVRLARMVRDLGLRVDDLERLRQKDFESFRSFRGRGYADRRWNDATATEEPQEPLNLNDPRLTKAQVKAALVARGALKPRSDN